MRSSIVRRPVVALTIPEDRRWHLRLDKEEAARRFRATPFFCDVAAMALEEGADMAALKLLAPVFGHRMTREMHVAAFPGYCRIRDFLIGELDADPLVACRVAHARVRLHNRHIRLFDDRDRDRGEWGWL